jgi:hypothetical protein
MVFPYVGDVDKFVELCNIAKYVSLLKPKLKPTKKRSASDYMLLLHFAVYPATSAYNYATPLSVQSTRSSGSLSEDTWLDKSSRSEYKDAKNQIPRLIKLGLVEQLDQPNVHKAKKCRLTKFGVYFVVESTSKLTPALFRNLLMGYHDDPMFRFFIYPLLNQDTLLRLKDDHDTFLSLMCSYLHNCCEELTVANSYMDIDRDLFVWEDIRTGNRDAKLLEFIAQKLGCTWLDKAEIQKSDKIIEVSRAGYSPVLIRLSDDRKKAILSYKDKKVELPVVKGTAIQISDLTTSTKFKVYKPRQLEMEHAKAFREHHVRLVQGLISSILLNNSINSDILEALGQDNKFREAVEDTKIKFDKNYNPFGTLQGGAISQ